MRYNFSRFSSGSFQSFVQSLALHVFGPGLQVYGSGPDGGRDATFDGRPRYPTPEAPWDGYTIIQAKFREKPLGDGRDADWLVKQLSADLEKLVDPHSKAKKPDYYLIATNVELSAVQGRSNKGGKGPVGGITKVETALKKYQSRIGYDGFAIWHAEQLRRLLDAAPTSLKRSYAAWTTPSDLIWELISQVKEFDLRKAVALAAARDLRDNKYTRLQEAGHVDAENTLLTRVFFDLPVLIERSQVPASLIGLGDTGSAGHVKARAVRMLTHYACEQFSTSAAKSQQTSPSSDRRGRIVVMGGPGQGKSTVGQFLVQLFQANLLSSPTAPEVALETRQYVAQVISTASTAGARTTLPFRIPIRINLPQFADSVALRKADGGSYSLLEMVAKQLSSQTAHSITPDHVRRLLRDAPWLVVLDGLDEVPPSGERTSVLSEIEALFDEAAAATADLLVVVTTRPQGYNKDLDPNLWMHWDLTPLQPAEAVEYATRLGNVRLAELMKRSRVLARLREASTAPSTAQLMISPLQVAILFTLVDLKGDVPTDRWSLFDRYFAVLRDREEEKGGHAGEILKKYKTFVELIHQMAGFLLHVEAEISGGAHSYLTNDQFEELTKRLLEEEGHEGNALEKLTRDLCRITTDRLVLLSPRIEGRIAFDVRSLQEYMAAALLTSAKDMEAEKRLRAVASASHWRHVFQIAASRCFTDTGKRHLAGTIINICAELDSGTDDEGDSLVLSGGRLALDLLNDGIGIDSPKQRKLLFERAIRLLDLGPTLYDERLGVVSDQYTQRACGEALRARMRNQGSRPALGAWRLAVDLHRKGKTEFDELFESFWPLDAKRRLEIVDLEPFDHVPAKLLTRFKSAFAESGFLLARRMEQFDAYLNKTLGFENRVDKKRSAGVPIQDSTLELKIVPIQTGERVQWDYITRWSPFNLAADFSRSPSPATLAATIEGFIDLPLDATEQIVNTLPWPIASVANIANDTDDLTRLASRARAGDFGDSSTWTAAERRWQSEGVSEKDLEFCIVEGEYFDARVDKIGMPSFQYVSHGQQRGSPSRQWGPLLPRLPRIECKKLRRHLFSIAVELAEASDSLSDEDIPRAVDEGVFSAAFFLYRMINSPKRNASDGLLQRLEAVGRRYTFADLAFWTRFGNLWAHSPRARPSFDLILQTLGANPALIGLLPIIWEGIRSDGPLPASKPIGPIRVHLPEATPPALLFCFLTFELMSGDTINDDVLGELVSLHRHADVDMSVMLESIGVSVKANAKGVGEWADAIARALKYYNSGKDTEKCILALRSVLDRRRSDLATRQRWRDLGLSSSIFEVLTRGLGARRSNQKTQ